MIMSKKLTIQEFQYQLKEGGVDKHQTTIGRWCEAKVISATKIGHQWYIVPSEVDRLLGREPVNRQ